MRPKEFSLIWRHNGRRPVTVWMPVSPPGYAALGAVVLGRPDVPAPHDFLCVREDLTAPARAFDSPIWTYDPAPLLQAAASGSRRPSAALAAALQPHHPETWRVSIWQVDNRLGSFLAVRAFSAPPVEMVRTVLTVEARAAARTAPPA